MTDHALTPEQMANLLAQHDRRAKLFERLATGRKKGEAARVVEDQILDTSGTDAERTARDELYQRRAIDRALFWYKVAKERVAAAHRHQTREAAAMAAADYTWKPARPARR